MSVDGVCTLLHLLRPEVKGYRKHNVVVLDLQVRQYEVAIQIVLDNITNLLWGVSVVFAAGWALLRYLQTDHTPVYLLDHCVLKPDDELQVSNDKFMEKSLASNVRIKDFCSHFTWLCMWKPMFKGFVQRS